MELTFILHFNSIGFIKHFFIGIKNLVGKFLALLPDILCQVQDSRAIKVTMLSLITNRQSYSFQMTALVSLREQCLSLVDALVFATVTK